MNLSRAIYVCGKRKRILKIRFRTAGPIYKELRGSLTKIQAERVSAAVDHRIRSGRPRSDLGERRGWASAGTVTGAAAPWPEEEGARRSFTRPRFRPRFSTKLTQGDRGGDDELTHGCFGGRESSRTTRVVPWRTRTSCSTSAVMRTPMRPLESKATDSAASVPRYDGRHVVAGEN